MAAKKGDQLVKEIAARYNSFADILNALWLRGLPAGDLARALAQTAKGTNDKEDIVARLINQGVNPDSIRSAVGTSAPPGTQFAFIATADKSRIIAHLNAPPTGPGQTAAPAGPSESGNILAFTQPTGGGPTPYVPAPAPAAPPPGYGAGGGGYGGGQQATPPPPKPTPQQIRAEIQAKYGWAAALMDVPEVAKILDDAGTQGLTPEEAARRFQATNYYKTTTQAQREWNIFEKTSPEDARAKGQEQRLRIQTTAAKLGLSNADPGRLGQIADLSLRYGWSDQQINQALSSEVHYDPQGAKSGVFGVLSGHQREWLVPVSDRAMESWASSIVGGTKTEEDFVSYLRDQAKSLFPALGVALDDPNLTTRKYLDPYAQIASKTLGINDADIDWMDPKWSRFINQVDDKGQRSVMSLADVQRTLMADPTYSYDSTANGKAQKAGLARGILESFGFASAGGGSFG